MSKEKFTYKSFCWSFGTTSFRTEHFNKTIEKQLILLNKFWTLPENKEAKWNEETQTNYYNFLKKEGFVEEEANNKPKDARQKTSGLVDIGIVDDNRHPTEAGEALLKMCEEGNFDDKNIFLIEKDSIFYLSQLLKVSYRINKSYIRPFIIFLKVLKELEYLSKEEFTYLLPLCIDKNSLNYIINAIKEIRLGKNTYDDVIVYYLLQMDNYKSALRYLIDTKDITEDVICDIGMNRKSRTYDIPYFELYKQLKKVYLDKDASRIIDLYNASKKIKQNPGVMWRSLLFDTSAKSAIAKDPKNHLRINDFINAKNEYDIKTIFFKYLHLIKAKATLADYQDLNYRFINTTDIVLFDDNRVKLDLIPNTFFKNRIDKFYEDAFIESKDLFKLTKIEEVSPCLAVNDYTLTNEINKECKTSFKHLSETRGFLDEKRYERFNKLIDSKFSKQDLLDLLELFEQRNDKQIEAKTTANADIPTIFEYVLAVIWYRISNKQIDILKSLKLDANLLPKSHAEGLRADILVDYKKNSLYPKHCLLLEATLASRGSQRVMEMEPVSRHLGEHLLKSDNFNDYCVFVTTSLNMNLVADFRLRKKAPYYSSDNSKHIMSMKIIPLQTSEIKTILQKNINYTDLYLIFNNAFNDELLLPCDWYNELIVNKL